MSKNINRRHHVVPSSRGGPDAKWNLCYFRIDPETQKVYIDFNTQKLEFEKDLQLHISMHTYMFHDLFANALPTEIINIIRKQWTKADGSLNRAYFPRNGRKIKAWVRLFGPESVLQTELAVIWLKDNKFTGIEGRWGHTFARRGRKNKI